MIKAIIFDCFGVLATEGFDNFKTEYLATSNEKLTQANTVMYEYNIGQRSYDSFIETLAQLAKTRIDIVTQALSYNQANKPLLNYIRTELKPKFKIGAVSNAGSNWLKDNLSASEFALFDDIVLSYSVGIIKPQKEIYELAARRLKASTADCIFIDDKQKHAQGAKATGMKAIVYKGFPSFKKELGDILATASDN